MLGIGAAQDAVVERFEGDPFARQLPLFVPVDVELGVERKMGAELDKERAELAVQPVNVIVVHHCG